MAALTTAAGHALGRAAERAAGAFYAIAALGSSIGQIWVGTDAPPWPDTMPLWLRALLASPFAVVIDLGGVVFLAGCSGPIAAGCLGTSVDRLATCFGPTCG